MILPTIHMNGTSAESLRDDNLKARAAIGDAIRALAAAGPNGRDYYTQGCTAGITAQREHESRIERLASVAEELYTIAIHCQDAIDAKENSRHSA